MTDAEQLEAEVEVRSWVQRAHCVGLDADLFFPDRGEPTRDAKAGCAGCEVREECLDYALSTGQKFGVWGGTSERERRALRRMRRTGEA